MICVHPKCVVCGNDWIYVDRSSKPIELINEEYVVDLHGHFTMWCCNGHDAMWYYQDEHGDSSFDMEINSLNLEVRWNCGCMEPICSGKNILRKMRDEDDADYHIIAEFDPPLPYNISIDTLKMFLVFQ